jgi:hypothetical protein
MNRPCGYPRQLSQLVGLTAPVRSVMPSYARGGGIRLVDASAGDETSYRRQVEQVYNRLALTGLPERDPRLNELPLDRIFVSLSVELPKPPPLPEPLRPGDGLRPGDDWRRVLGDHALSEALQEQQLRQLPVPLPLGVAEALQRHRPQLTKRPSWYA